MARKKSPESSPGPSQSQNQPQIEDNDWAYDPDQDPNEKRGIRRDFRVVGSNIEDMRSDLTNAKVEDMTKGLKQLNTIFERVKDTSEAVLDSKNLMNLSDMAAQKAKLMKSDAGTFDVDDFISKLVTYMGGRRGGIQDRDRSESLDQDDEEELDLADGSGMLDWGKIGRLSLGKSHRVPVIDFMLGPLSTEQKQRKKITRAKFDKGKEPERAPQELNEADIMRNENETTRNVTKIRDLLEGTGKINFFRFVVNPMDFGQSVENVFYLSFLIREAKCALEFDEETAEPMIFACEEPTEEDFKDGIQKQQIVLEFDMDTWRSAIEVFDITECTIPDRPKLEEVQAQERKAKKEKREKREKR
ncbi:hypothetical protein M422DRAFT_224972 [Sphaerobolus stellatus SS14]|nr:hypothetical protein M422DRAFT_224972 [Sphaerobolus stellatus SS14]